MKEYTVTELNEIIQNMKNGAIYCGIDKYRRGIGAIRTDNQYIRYSHYGSSAVETKTDRFEWLLNVIFKDCSEIVPAVWSEYHINYIPINDKYIGIDCSAKHPNVYNL